MSDSNGVANSGTDQEKVEEHIAELDLEARGTEAASAALRATTIRRRAKLLSILDGAGIEGVDLATLVRGVVDVAPEALADGLVENDLAQMMEARFAERRDPLEPGGPALYILTLAGSKACEDRAWHQVAEKTLVEHPPARPAADEGLAVVPSPSWSLVVQASAEKASQEAADAAEAKDGKRGRNGKKGKGASPQLGLSDTPGRFKMDLPCPVPEGDMLVAQREHLDACDRIDLLEEDRKAEMRRFAERRAELEEQEQRARARLREAIAGRRIQPVDCEAKLDGSTMRVFRCDTGEMVEERAATPAELDAANPPPPAAPPPEGAEVREPSGSPEETTVSSTSEASEPAPSTEPAKADEEPGQRPRRQRKAKADAAAVH